MWYLHIFVFACVCRYAIYINTYIIIKNSFRLFRLIENFATSEWEQDFATEPIWDLINSLDPNIHVTFGKISENIDIFDVNDSIEKNKPNFESL